MRIKIHFKITAFFVGITAIILWAGYTQLSRDLAVDAYARLNDNLAKELNLAKSYLENNSPNNFSGNDLDQTADSIARDLGLRVTIISADGKVLGDSDLDGDRLAQVENHFFRPEVQEAFKTGSGKSRRFSTTLRKEMLYMAVAYAAKDEKGIVRLAVPLSEIEGIFYRLRKTIFSAILFAFIWAIVISFVVSGYISGPIKKISLIAREIADGDLSKKVFLQTNDEIEDLAQAFNRMVEQLKSRVDEALASKSRSEAVLVSMFEGVMVVDRRNSVLFMNQSLQTMLQIEGDPAGKKPIEIIRNVEVQNIVENVLEGREEFVSREVVIILPEEKTLLIHATPIRKEQQAEGAVLVFHDVTELRKFERIRQDFVANVSHELRTPLSSIKGYAETLLEGALEDKENARDFLQIIYTESERLSKLIDDLLKLTLVESGKMEVELKPLALLPVAERAVRGLEPLLRKKAIRIKFKISKDLPDVLADENLLSQIFLNLIDNAVKYNRLNGEITITAAAKGAMVQVDISDTGIGIPAKDLPRIFERFYRVDKARSRELGGTGLGLSIVNNILKAHHGKAFVTSVEGQGSTFSFTLPKA